MIRSTEQSEGHKGHSTMAAMNKRIPIFAVSASLVEEKKPLYIDAGFDGWILKPIDFKRLSTLLAGIYETDTRRICLYAPGAWEHGGWFSLGEDDDSQAGATPTADGEGRLLTTGAKLKSPS